MTSCAATGISYGPTADPEHAAKAVKQALDRTGRSSASAVVLFLTPEYAHTPDRALRAAARAAGCTQIVGCTGAGILTEDEWLLDATGAAAMVLHEPVSISHRPGQLNVSLDLTTPEAISSEWIDSSASRFGAVAADVVGQGPFTVWRSGRPAEDGHVEMFFQGVDGAMGISQGIRMLTAPVAVGEVDGYDVLQIGKHPALSVLTQALPFSVGDSEPFPLHLLMCGVTFGDPETAVADGRFKLNHIVSANRENRSITLSSALNPGERLFWGIRDKLAAERDMEKKITALETKLAGKPEFAMLFPCITRGPSFYGNRDRDIEILKNRYPSMPVIGFYGNGQIAPLSTGSHLYQYSAAIGLYRSSNR